MKKSTFKTFFFCLLFTLSPLILIPGGEHPSATEIEGYDQVQMKAGFIFRVSNLIMWPEQSNVSDTSVPFVIGVVGEEELTATLMNFIGKNTIKGKDVQILSIAADTLENLEKCNVLFIGEFSRRKFKHIIDTVNNYPILTIGDTKGYDKKGVMINLNTPSSSKISFAVNCISAEKNGIRLTSKIVKYATSRIK